jgi:hypothetical protein
MIFGFSIARFSGKKQAFHCECTNYTTFSKKRRKNPFQVQFIFLGTGDASNSLIAFGPAPLPAPLLREETEYRKL